MVKKTCQHVYMLFYLSKSWTHIWALGSIAVHFRRLSSGAEREAGTARTTAEGGDGPRGFNGELSETFHGAYLIPF